MNDKLKMFEQKHGEEIKLNLKDGRVRERNNRLNELSASTFSYLLVLGLSVENGVWIIPCKQCLLNTAVEFEEIGSLLRELAD